MYPFNVTHSMPFVLLALVFRSFLGRCWGGGTLQESSGDGDVQKYRGGVGTTAGAEGVDEACRGDQEEDRTRSVGESIVVVFRNLNAVLIQHDAARAEPGREGEGEGDRERERERKGQRERRRQS